MLTTQDGAVRVLHVTLSSGPGGGPEHVFQLVSNLTDDVKNYIAAPDEYPYGKKYRKLVGEDNICLMPSRKFQLSSLWRLLRFVLKNEVDIIHSHGKGAGVYSRVVAILTRRKSIHTFHGLHLNYRPTINALYLLVEKVLGTLTSRFICVSSGERRVILDNGITSFNKVHVIVNGVAVSERRQLSPPTGRIFTVIQMTRFDFAKNTELLLDIAEILKEAGILSSFRFVLLGEGEKKDECEKRSRELGVADAFLFAGYQENPRTWLQGGSPDQSVGQVGCYLTTSRWEGLPLSVLESMAEGIPVIASDVVGNNDIIKNNVTGLLYDLEDPHEAAERLVALSNDRSLWKKLSLNGQKLVAENYTVGQMARRTHKLYIQLMNSWGDCEYNN